ncbi:MAG: hypothetical protein ACRDIB_02610, partial [Ardenticatenaceae bacterium]
YDTDLAERMREMEPELLHLLTREITSLGSWDALRYFLETGEEEATLDEIGMAAGRDSTAMLDILGALTGLGWLSRRANAGGKTVYKLTQERSRRALLDQFHTSLHDRLFRLQAMYHWTRGR